MVEPEEKVDIKVLTTKLENEDIEDSKPSYVVRC
jgi:hypothetical protein